MQDTIVLNDEVLFQLQAKMNAIQQEMLSLGRSLSRIPLSREAGGELKVGRSIRLTCTGQRSGSGDVREAVDGYAALIIGLAGYAARFSENVGRIATNMQAIERELVNHIDALGEGNGSPFDSGEAGGGGGSGGGGKPSEEAVSFLERLLEQFGIESDDFAVEKLGKVIAKLLGFSDIDSVWKGLKQTLWSFETAELTVKTVMSAFGKFADSGTAGSRVADYFLEFLGKGSRMAGKETWEVALGTAAKWAGPILSTVISIYDNVQEWEESDGAMSTERMVKEIIVESAIEIGMDALIGAAVVAAPVTGGASLVLGVGLTAVWGLANVGCEMITDKSVTEWVSDGYLDFMADVEGFGKEVLMDSAEFVSDKVSDFADYMTDRVGEAVQFLEGSKSWWDTLFS